MCYWDISAYKKGETTMDPVTTYHGHSSVVEDVAWHNLKETLFASVGDDRSMLM